VFQVTSGQDYGITASTSLDVPEGPDWRNLSNSEWMKAYNDEYVSGYSDLILVSDTASSRVSVLRDWSYSFDSSSPEDYDWHFTRNMTDIAITLSLNPDTQVFLPSEGDDYRVIYQIKEGSSFSLDIDKQWPQFDDVYVPNRYQDNLTLCTRTDGTIWLVSPSDASLRVEYAFAKVQPYASKIQIGIPFLAVVIVANSLKVTCIFFTLRQCSSGSIVTVGDAIATFLQDPDPLTKDKCLYTQVQLREKSEKVEPRYWKQKRRRKASVIGGKGVTIANL
jgi:hypothetical protein